MLSSDKLKKLVIVSGGTTVALLPVAAHADESIQGAVDSVQPANAATGSLQTNIKNIINVMLILIGIVAVIMLIVGGFRYVLSNGNEKAVSGAKDTILYAVIGIVVALLSFAIVNFVLGQFTF
jgi:magnesium-transporting ATPase (P-type)